MAYLPSTYDEEQKGTGQATGTQPITSSAGVGAPSSTVAGTGSAVTPAQSQPSYPGVMAYMHANQGAGTNLGNAVKSQVGGEAQAASDKYNAAKGTWDAGNQSAISQWQTAYSNAAGANNQAQADYDAALSDYYTHRPDQQYRGKQVTTPEYGNRAWSGYQPAVTRTYSEANPYYQKGYKAPKAPTLQSMPEAPTLTDFTPDASLTQAAQAASDEIASLGTDAGRSAVLGQMNASPTYSTGARNFDAALLSGANPYGDLMDQYGSILNTLRSGATVAAPTVAAPDVAAYAPVDHGGETFTYRPRVEGQTRDTEFGPTSYGGNPAGGSGNAYGGAFGNALGNVVGGLGGALGIPGAGNLGRGIAGWGGWGAGAGDPAEGEPLGYNGENAGEFGYGGGDSGTFGGYGGYGSPTGYGGGSP